VEIGKDRGKGRAKEKVFLRKRERYGAKEGATSYLMAGNKKEKKKRFLMLRGGTQNICRKGGRGKKNLGGGWQEKK